MLPGYDTISGAVRNGKIPFCLSKAQAAADLGYMKTFRVGNYRLVSDQECERMRENPPRITREELAQYRKKQQAKKKKAKK